MDTIEPDKFTRDSKLIDKLVIQKDKTVIALEDFYMLIPDRYITSGLAKIDTDIKTLAIAAIVYKQKYTLLNAPIYLTFEPTLISDVEIDGKLYKKLDFNKDMIVSANTDIVVDTGVFFLILNEFFINGNVPWYMGYEDLSNILSLSDKYLSNKLGNNTLTMELLTSIITKLKKNSKIDYRYSITENSKEQEITFIGLQNLFRSFKDTTSKLVGSYFSNGVTSALVDKEEEVTKVEYLLRK